MNFTDGRKFSFDRKEFEDEDFSVDEWIQKKRYSLPLDVLRDDLGYFLKCLRSFLIELINQDYGQFVSLSASLVGLDGKIQNIIGPLNKSRNELQILYQALSSTLSRVEDEVYLLQKIRYTKAQLKHLRLANSSLESSFNCIRSVPLQIQTDSDFKVVCLTSSEVGATKFFLQCCDTVVNLHPMLKLDDVCGDLLSRLAYLLEVYSEPSATDSKTKSWVTSVLHAYAELNAEQEAEQVFVDKVVKPKCKAILAKTGNFTALLDAIEIFMSVCPVIQFNQRSHEFSWVSKFDFVGRGLFPQVLDILSKHFPHIWSPSEPNSFFSNWIRCETFLKIVESSLPSQQHLITFRNSLEFKQFLSRWQFHVYFHLRFHALAVELETSLENIEVPTESGSDFKLKATQVTVDLIKECWNKKKVYISHLSGRFLKASSLFISRFLAAVCNYLDHNKKISSELLITLCSDLTLAELVVNQIMTDKINEIVQVSDKSNVSLDFLSGFSWKPTRVAITNRLISTLVEQSLGCISSVTEIPRLFRRTNRDNPVKPSEYVDNIILPVQSLKKAIDVAQVKHLWSEIVVGAGYQIVTRYHSQIQEVLTSVSRMEESLKRLKKVKGQNQNATNKPGLQGDVRNLSDDDKIRRQIQLDVTHFGSRMTELCPEVDTTILSQVVGT